MGAPASPRAWATADGKIDPGSQARVWREVEGLMAGLSAAKPCVKKKAGWPGKPVPDPVAGIRDVELFSPPSRAPAQPRLERVRWEGGAGIPVCSSPVCAQGNWVQVGLGRLVLSRTCTGPRHAIETVGRSCSLPAWCRLEGINRGRLFPSCQSHAFQKLHMFSLKRAEYK